MTAERDAAFINALFNEKAARDHLYEANERLLEAKFDVSMAEKRNGQVDAEKVKKTKEILARVERVYQIQLKALADAKDVTKHYLGIYAGHPVTHPVDEQVVMDEDEMR